MGNGQYNEIFIHAGDDTAALINQKANELYHALKNFDAAALDTNDKNNYFIHHHLGSRLFFSIQNSVHILYEAIALCKKPLAEINGIDYGAGLGTLFMLGGMLGFKRFDYNDHLPEWQSTAAAVCTHTGSHITSFVTGDINSVASFAAANNFCYDIVLSRNVIEHIYSLHEFYSVLYKHNPHAVIYSTTTANYYNPAMHGYHIYIHKKVEKTFYRQQRLQQIKKLQPALSAREMDALVELTRGKGGQDFADAVNSFVNKKSIATDKSLRSNTCDCMNGVWSEHLLTKKEYSDVIEQAGFKLLYTAGYWDTHYNNALKNIAARYLNKIIAAAGKKTGVIFSPFVNVIAYN